MAQSMPQPMAQSVAQTPAANSHSSFFSALLALPLSFALWLGRFLRARVIGWGFLLLLTAVAYFSARLALDTQIKTPRAVATPGQKHAPDFTAKQFTIWRSSLDGSTQYQLNAESMVHYRDNLSSEFVRPVLVAKTNGPVTAPVLATLEAAAAGQASPTGNKHNQLSTTITAGNGLMRNEGELLQFTNAVKVVRKSAHAPLSTLETDSLVVMPDADWVVTRSHVKLTQGKHQSIGKGGLEYSHTDADLVLLGGTRTTLAPK